MERLGAQPWGGAMQSLQQPAPEGGASPATLGTCRPAAWTVPVVARWTWTPLALSLTGPGGARTLRDDPFHDTVLPPESRAPLRMRLAWGVADKTSVSTSPDFWGVMIDSGLRIATTCLIIHAPFVVER